MLMIVVALVSQQADGLGAVSDRQEYPDGNCTTPKGEAIDMDRVELIRNLSVVISADGPKVYARIDRDLVLTARDRAFEGARFFHNVPPMIDSAHMPDIVLSHARIGSDRYIYWTETYVNRPNRQGLMTLTETNLVPYCQGTHGVLVLH